MIGSLTELLAYGAIPLVVGVTGYIAGYETCVITHHQHRTPFGVLMARRTPADDQPPSAADQPADDGPRRRRVGGLDLGVVGYLLAALALVVAGFTAYQGQAQERELIACLNTYANQSADATEARVHASTARNKAITRAFASVSAGFRGQADRGEIQRAIDAYLAADAKLTHQQRVNPYPDPPREVCP